MIDPTLGLRDLDLNLLLALHVMLEENSVSRAARRLGRTPSATSRMLSRLRESLDDPLFVRSGRGLRPTPRAEAARQPLAAALGALAEVSTLGGDFDPATAARTFTLAGPDALAPLSTALLRVFQIHAPGCGLTLLPGPPHPAPALLGGGVDVVLGPDQEVGADLRRRGLGAVRWASVVRAGHPLLEKGAWTLPRWTAFPHVLVRTGNASKSLVDRVLAAHGHTRRVQVAAPGLLAALHLVAAPDSTLVATAPLALAGPVAAQLGLVVMAPPVPLPDTPVVAWWSPRLHSDPGHRWFRQQVAAAALDLLQGRVSEPSGQRMQTS